MSFEARHTDFGQLWGRNNDKYIIPRYQREYSWNREDVEIFWNDLNEPTQDLFLGSLVLKEKHNSRIEIIDGQQRMITISILYAALRECAQKNGFPRQADKIHQDRLVEIGDFDDEEIGIIQVAPSLRDYFTRTIQKFPKPNFSNPRTKEEQRVRKNYLFFSEQMGKAIEKCENEGERKQYLSTLLSSIKQIKLIEIRVSDSYDAYRIFESMNARGVDLSVADLLKNMIFSELDLTDSGEDIAQRKWTMMKENLHEINIDTAKFIRYHWISSNNFLTMNKLYNDIKNKTIDKQSWNRLLENLVNDSITLKHLYLGNIENLNKKSDIDRINSSLRNIATMGFSQCYVLLLSVFRNKESLSMSWENLRELVGKIEVFNFRYHTIASMPANRVEKFYSETAKGIQELVKSDYAEERLQSTLRGIDVHFGSILPNSSEFREKFVQVSYTTSKRARQRILYILKKFELYLVPNHGEELAFSENLSIEHLLPQEPSKWGLSEDDVKPYVHNIGNLVLLGKKLNSEAKNYPLNKKIAVLKSSNILSTKKIINQVAVEMKWDEKEILKRSILLSEIADEKIWPMVI